MMTGHVPLLLFRLHLPECLTAGTPLEQHAGARSRKGLARARPACQIAGMPRWSCGSSSTTGTGRRTSRVPPAPALAVSARAADRGTGPLLLVHNCKAV